MTKHYTLDKVIIFFFNNKNINYSVHASIKCDKQVTSKNGQNYMDENA